MGDAWAGMDVASYDTVKTFSPATSPAGGAQVLEGQRLFQVAVAGQRSAGGFIAFAP